MKFRTEINLPKTDIQINHQTQILMLGSCFANSIGEKMWDNKLNTIVNPFGTLYNPVSIKIAIDLLISKKEFTLADLFYDKGVYSSLYHHSSYSDADANKVLANINDSLKHAGERLRNADLLFITFGTAYVYKHIDLDVVVGNCHKLSASTFRRYRLDVNDIVIDWSALLSRLQTLNPKLRVIFTVSPIRHLRDGAHDNQLSKSTLLVAIDELNKKYPTSNYFPAYELVIDDLRDYRFYDTDMCHPNALAIDYIWNKFKASYLTEQSMSICQEWEKLHLAINHKAINPETKEHIDFLNKTLLMLNNFGAKHPYICLQSEIDILNSNLKK